MLHTPEAMCTMFTEHLYTTAKVVLSPSRPVSTERLFGSRDALDLSVVVVPLVKTAVILYYIQFRVRVRLAKFSTKLLKLQ